MKLASGLHGPTHTAHDPRTCEMRQGALPSNAHLSRKACRSNLGAMSRHITPVWSLGALLGVAALMIAPAMGADLGYHRPPPPQAPAPYYALPPSPCLDYERSFTEALHSARATAASFRG